MHPSMLYALATEKTKDLEAQAAAARQAAAAGPAAEAGRTHPTRAVLTSWRALPVLRTVRTR